MKKFIFFIGLFAIISIGILFQNKQAQNNIIFSRDIVSVDSGNYNKGQKDLIEMFKWSSNLSGAYINGAFDHLFDMPTNKNISMYKKHDNLYEVNANIKNSVSFIELNNNVTTRFINKASLLSLNECIGTMKNLQSNIKRAYGHSKNLSIISDNDLESVFSLGNGNQLKMNCSNNYLLISLYKSN